MSEIKNVRFRDKVEIVKKEKLGRCFWCNEEMKIGQAAKEGYSTILFCSADCWEKYHDNEVLEERQ